MTIKKQMRHVFRCPVIFGKDGTGLQAGYDCTWYGDEEDANFMWDASANRMIFTGAAGITINGDCDYAIDITDGVIRDTQTISAAAIDLNMDIDMATAGAAHVPVLYIDANQSTAYSGGALSCIKGKVYTTEHITNVYGAQLWAYSSGTHTMNDLTCVHAIVITGGAITADTPTSSTCSALSGYISNYSTGSWDGRVACLFLNYGSNVNYGNETAYIYMMSHGDTKLDYGIHFTCLSSQQAVTAAILIEPLSGATVTTGIDIDGAGTVTTGIDIGACGTGINITGATTNAIVISGTPTTTDITFHNGATIMNTSGVLTIVEDLITITGNLQVDGTTTTINTATWTVDDPNVQLNAVGSPSDSNANGGGITLRSDAGDKTIIWDNANDNWTFNQSVNLSSGLVYKINNVEVLSASTLTLSEGATIADSAGNVSAGTGPSLTITQDQIGLTGKVEIGYTDWGVAGAGAIAITGDGWDWALQVNAKVTANLADAGAATYHSMTVTASQTSSSIFGTWTELYFSDSIDLSSSDNYAAIWGQIEAGTGVTFTDGEFTAAFYGNVKAGTSCVGQTIINGFRAKLEIASADSFTPGASRLAAFETAASDLDWDFGLFIPTATASVGVGVGVSGTPMVLAAATDHAMDIFTTTSATSAINLNAVYIEYNRGASTLADGRDWGLKVRMDAGNFRYNTMTGVYSTIEIGSGGTLGRASAVQGEVILDNVATTSGAYSALNAEIGYAGGNSNGLPGPVSFMSCIFSGTEANFIANAYLFEIDGGTPGATNLISADSQTARCIIGEYGSGLTRYLVFSDVENCLNFAGGTTRGTAIEIGSTSTGIQVNDSPDYVAEMYADIPTGAVTISNNLGTMNKRLTLASGCNLTSGSFQTVSYNRFEIAGTATLQGWNCAVFGYFKTATSGVVGGEAGMNSAVCGVMNLQSGFTDASESTGCFMAATSSTGSNHGSITEYTAYLVVDLGADEFDNGFYLGNNAAATAFKSGICTTGINLAGAMTTGINLSGATITTGIDLSGTITTGISSTSQNLTKFINVGTFDTPITYDAGSNEFVEIFTVTNAAGDSKPAFRIRNVPKAGTNQTSGGRVIALQVQSGSATTYDIFTIRALQAGCYMKGAADVQATGDYTAAEFTISDLGAAATIASGGQASCIMLQVAFTGGGTISGVLSHIRLHSMSINLDAVFHIPSEANTIVETTGAPGYVDTAFILSDEGIGSWGSSSAAMISSGSLNDSANTDDILCDARIKVDLGGVDYWIPLYNSAR